MIRVEALRKDFRIGRALRRELGADAPPGGRLPAVDGVDLTCRPGRVQGLLGPNGAGKTTLLRMLATMLRPSGGRFWVCEVDGLAEPHRVRGRIGFLTGSTGLYDRLTALETVRYVADLHAMDPDRFEARRNELFAALDLEEVAHRRVAQLSTGMRQRVSIARTIIHDPDVVILDEPTTGLDVMTSRAIVRLIRECRDRGKTVLLSTHQMGPVQTLCDDIAILHRGRLHFAGTRERFEAEMTEPTYEDEFLRRVGERS